ncbi:hypothetical protein RCL1_006934 [Eukaryota sp. TZLM3-RCL]
MSRSPVIVLQQNTQRQTGRKAQISNIAAAKTVGDIVRSTLGPQSMLKMLVDPMAGLQITNDGNCILREIDVAHPAARTMIELARSQDEEVGDGTTSVIILTSALLAAAEPLLNRNIHPTIIVEAFNKFLHDALERINTLRVPFDISNRDELVKLVRSSLGTKFVNRWMDLMCSLAVDAVTTITLKEGMNPKEVDIKKYARIEKIPGAEIEDSTVLRGVCLNKDIVHPQMKRTLRNPRVLLLDCPIEYKKAESQTNVEISQEGDWEVLLKQEEEYISRICNHILSFKPDVVVTEKGIADYALHFFVKAGISALRRVRKTDNNRIARATGATIVNRADEIKESDIGTGCGLFEVRKIGDEYFSFFDECTDPKACTILLRGASKDILNEVERNLHDAMYVARNIMFEPFILLGAGSTEMALSVQLTEESSRVEGIIQLAYKAAASALEVIPKTLAQNCGASVIRVVTALRAEHAKGNYSTGVDGVKGTLVDVKEIGVFEPIAVKTNVLKTAVEAASLLLRIDDIVSGVAKKEKPAQGQQSSMEVEQEPQGDLIPE